MSEEGIEAQFTVIKAWPARCDPLCTARAINSFRYLFRPNQHRRVSGGDFDDLERTVFKAGEEPTISSNMKPDHLLPEDHVLVVKAVFQPFDFR